MAMLVIDWAQWPSFHTTQGWWCEKCSFLIIFLSFRLFSPSIITCPRDWVTVVQSAGKGSLFDICWVERREEKALIIESYFPLFTQRGSWGLYAYSPISTVSLPPRGPFSSCPPQPLPASALAGPDPQRPVVDSTSWPLFFFFNKF